MKYLSENTYNLEIGEHKYHIKIENGTWFYETYDMGGSDWDTVMNIDTLDFIKKEHNMFLRKKKLERICK